MQSRARRTLLSLLFAQFLLAASLTGAQTAGVPTPKPPPPPPPIPPTPPVGPLPWRLGKEKNLFFTDRSAIESAIKQSSKPRLVLEDYRQFTESSLRELELSREAGKIDRHTYKQELSQYGASINVYRQLSPDK